MSASSVLWNFYTVPHSAHTHAECNFCKKKITRGGKTPKDFGTTGLKNHLRSHPAEFAKFESLAKATDKEREEIKKTTAPAKTTTIVEAFARAEPWDINSEKAKVVDQRIGEMMAFDSQAFSVVDNAGFSRLLRCLEPHYKLPSRKYFTENVKEKVSALLKEADAISYTSDLWTSNVNNAAFISLTAHFVDSKFKPWKLVLHTRHFPGGHTSARISDCITVMLAEWGDSGAATNCFVTDNGANIVKTVKDLGIKSIPCAAHTLQLAVNDCIGSQRAVIDVIAVARRIVGHFNHSSKACDRLRDLQTELGIPVKKLVQDVTTRWNSTLYMLESLLEQKRALVVYAAESSCESLTGHQWNIVEKVFALLQPVEQVSKQLCLDSTTASMVGPLSLGLIRSIDKSPCHFVGTMKADLLTAIQQRFNIYITDEEVTSATLLDPRYKTAFLSENVAEAAKHAVLRLIGASSRASSEEPPRASSEEPETHDAAPVPVKKQKAPDVWDCLEELAGASSAPSAPMTTRAAELDTYLALPRANKDTAPLHWWKSHAEQLPKLASIARRLLSAPATSVSSERLFSIAGNVLTDSRSRMTPKNAEIQIFLHENLRLLDFDY